MASNLAAIIAGIAAQLRTIPAFKSVVTYKPDQPGPLPMVYFQSLHWDYPETTYGEMTIGWTPEAYVVIAPITAKAEAAEHSLYTLVPLIIEAIGHDLDAHGALDRTSGTSDGQVVLTEADEGQVIIGGSVWYAVRLRFRVIETFTYDHTL